MSDNSKASAELTFGERAVGISFNPGGDPTVNAIKQKCAEIIDLYNDARSNSSDPEVKRMYSVAITEIQTGQMWGVKAATWK